MLDAPISIGGYMFFRDFRKIVQSYCWIFDIHPFPSYRLYKNLHREYNFWFYHQGSTHPLDDDISVAKFLDKKDLLNMIVSYDSVCAFAPDWGVKNVPFQTTAPQPPSPKGFAAKLNAGQIKRDCEKQQEGNTPMTINTERDYLARRLENAKYVKIDKKFTDMFNLDSKQQPSTYKELIDWIQNKKFKLDDKRAKLIDATLDGACDGDYYYGPFDGIIFTANPVPDTKGYEQAKKDMNKQYQNARDIVMTSDAAAGLKALQDFEAWMPTVTNATAQ